MKNLQNKWIFMKGKISLEKQLIFTWKKRLRKNIIFM